MNTLKQAAQAALDALERYQVKRQDFDRFADEVAALRRALAQPEPQPVAWAVVVFGNVQGHSILADSAEELAREWRKQDPEAAAVPLYTHPAPGEVERLRAALHKVIEACNEIPEDIDGEDYLQPLGDAIHEARKALGESNGL